MDARFLLEGEVIKEGNIIKLPVHKVTVGDRVLADNLNKVNNKNIPPSVVASWAPLGCQVGLQIYLQLGRVGYANGGVPGGYAHVSDPLDLRSDGCNERATSPTSRHGFESPN